MRVGGTVDTSGGHSSFFDLTLENPLNWNRILTLDRYIERKEFR